MHLSQQTVLKGGPLCYQRNELIDFAGMILRNGFEDFYFLLKERPVLHRPVEPFNHLSVAIERCPAQKDTLVGSAEVMTEALRKLEPNQNSIYQAGVLLGC